MRVHAEVVAEAVREEGRADALPQQLLGRAVAQDADAEQARDGDLVRAQMQRLPAHAGLEERESGRLHLLHERVDVAALGVEGDAAAAAAAEGRRASDVGAVARPFRAGVHEDVLPAVEGLVVVLVVQRRCVGARAEDAVVGLVFGARGDAGGDEDGLEVLLVAGGGDGAQDGGVGAGGDGVGVAEEGDFVGVFGDAALVDGGVEEGGIGRESCDGRGELRSHGVGLEVEGWLGFMVLELGEVFGEFRGREAGIDVVFLESIGREQWEAGPDYGVWVERRDEKGQAGGGDIVDEMAVGERTSAEVEERTTLTIE